MHTIKSFAAAAVLAVALIAALAPTASAGYELQDDYVTAKDGQCIFRASDGGRRSEGWCPDWKSSFGTDSAPDGSCVFRPSQDGGGFGWCPDWNGADGSVISNDCVFQPVRETAGSVAWCPDWHGEAENGCVFRDAEAAWCPDWLGLRDY